MRPTGNDSPLATAASAAGAAVMLRRRFAGALGDTDAFLQRFAASTREHILTDLEFARAFTRATTANGAPMNADTMRAMLVTEGLRAWGICRWYDCGLAVLAPTQSLAAALVLSTYPALAVGDVPWPFDSFVIELPRPWLPPPFDTLSLIWVHRAQAFASETKTEGLVDTIRVEATGTDGVAYDEMALCTASVEGWIESRKIREFSAAMNEQELAVGRLCTRLAIGLAVYMGALPSANRALAKRRVPASRRQPGSAPAPQVWDLGRDIKLPRELRLAAVDFANARRALGRSGWRLSRRFTVRGHFRRTVVGPRALGERRWTWVKPFWKGPEEGIALRRTYVVGQEG